MRRSDFWERLNAVLGAEYAASWSRDVVLPSLGECPIGSPRVRVCRLANRIVNT
ncbi:MAG: DUF3046 domain-containing protein [Actinobacteria bacterium]|nr:DUF3046 domain-containing protein [Actinomycetota bacterium]